MLTGECRGEWWSHASGTAEGQCNGWEFGDFYADYPSDLEGAVRSETVRNHASTVVESAGRHRVAAAAGTAAVDAAVDAAAAAALPRPATPRHATVK